MIDRDAVRFVEPSSDARRWFWIIVLIWVSVAAFQQHFDYLFPVSGSAPDQIEQLAKRSRCAVVLMVAFYLALSLVAIVLAVKTIRTRQWPPRGMAVPFRARVTEILRPKLVWLYTAIMLLLFSIQIGTTIQKWRVQNRIFEQALQSVRPADRSP